MKNKADEILQKMYDNFLDENNKLKSELQNNLQKIEEIKVFLNSISDNEMDYNVFSPRKRDLRLSDTIQENTNEIVNLDYRNQEIYRQINKIDSKLFDLQDAIIFYSNREKADSLNSLDIQEKERQRIARDLHDYSLQNLTHIIHVLELSSLFIDQDPARAKLELVTAAKKIKETIEDIRNIIFDLRPMEIDDLGLKDTLLKLISKLSSQADIFIYLEMEEDIRIEDDIIFSNLYRIINECITNSIKHSGGKEIKITISMENNICHIEIKDNGKGFNCNFSDSEKKRHFGLQILEERVNLLKGDLNIYSGKDASGHDITGTMVSIQIPLQDIVK